MDSEGVAVLICAIFFTITIAFLGYFCGVSEVEKSVFRANIIEVEGRGFKCSEVK